MGDFQRKIQDTYMKNGVLICIRTIKKAQATDYLSFHDFDMLVSSITNNSKGYLFIKNKPYHYLNFEENSMYIINEDMQWFPFNKIYLKRIFRAFT